MVQSNAPDQAEITRVTNAIIEELGSVDLESALTVVCNLAGQLVASLSNGQPSMVQAHGDNVADFIKKAAINKLLHDSDLKRKNGG